MLKKFSGDEKAEGRRQKAEGRNKEEGYSVSVQEILEKYFFCALADFQDIRKCSGARASARVFTKIVEKPCTCLLKKALKPLSILAFPFI